MATLAPRVRRTRRLGILLILVAVPVVALVAIALGLLVHKLPRTSVGALFVGVLALLVFGFIVARGPRACLAMLVATAIFGMNVHSVGGKHGLRAIDLFWFALVIWMLHIRAKEGRILGRQVGQRQVGIWLLALLVSLYPVAVYASSGFTDAFIAWARLAETISLVWLVPYALRSIEDVEFMLGVIELALAAEIVWAIGQAVANGTVAERLAGHNGSDTTGLLAALLIAMSFHSPVPRAAPRAQVLRAALFVLGMTGLVMTKSVGSLAAAGVMLGIFGLRSMATRNRSPHGQLLTPARFLLLVLAVLALAATIRPGTLPTSKGFSQSTAMNRIVVGTAGLELFRDHPIVGVGWSRAPDEIGSDKIDRQLRDVFGNSVRRDFLPKQNPTSVHDSYVEILAEAGLVGFACFVALLVVGARGIRAILRRADRDVRIAASAWCAAVLLVGVLVWWNDNALFGAQPETVLAATFLGILAATPLVSRRPRTTDAAAIESNAFGMDLPAPPR